MMPLYKCICINNKYKLILNHTHYRASAIHNTWIPSIPSHILTSVLPCLTTNTLTQYNIYITSTHYHFIHVSSIPNQHIIILMYLAYLVHSFKDICFHMLVIQLITLQYINSKIAYHYNDTLSLLLVSCYSYMSILILVHVLPHILFIFSIEINSNHASTFSNIYITITHAFKIT